SRRGRDEGVPEHRERSEHPLHVLVLQDRGDDDVTRTREAGQSVAEPGEVVVSVPDLERIVADALEPPRETNVDVPVDRMAGEGLGGGERKGKVAPSGNLHSPGAVRAGEGLPPRAPRQQRAT